MKLVKNYVEFLEFEYFKKNLKLILTKKEREYIYNRLLDNEERFKKTEKTWAL